MPTLSSVDRACVAAQPALSSAAIDVKATRRYLSQVYPRGAASLDSATDERVLELLSSRQWFYAETGRTETFQLPEPIASSLIAPSRHVCKDGFFGSGLLQRDVRTRFADILPCTPGTECVRRQSAHMPHCAAEVASRGNDVWLEVWHLAFDGRHRPRQRPKGWSDFLDAGQSGWWYIHAPGSGIFYHAGRTIAAPSKAAMLAQLLEEWSAVGAGATGTASRRRGGSSGGGVNGGGGGGARDKGNHDKKGGDCSGACGDAGGVAKPPSSFSKSGASVSRALDRESLKLIERFTDNPSSTARIFRRLLEGVPCHNVSWGRWRCVGDFIPSDTWDPCAMLPLLLRAHTHEHS